MHRRLGGYGVGLLALLIATLFSEAGSRSPLDVQAHRGGRGLLPENSLPAFRHALELGVTTLELDLQATADRVLVVYHDWQLQPDRCVHEDGRRVAATPLIELTVDELADIDCGTLPHPGFPEQKQAPAPIPRLDEVLGLALDADYPVKLSLEIKLQKKRYTLPPDEFAELLVHELGDPRFEGRVIVQSFAPEALAAMARLEPEIDRAILVRDRAKYEQRVEASQATILSPKHGGLRRSDVEHFQGRGIQVIPWTVNSPEAIGRMLDWGVDGIISDYPDRVMEALGEERREPRPR